MKALDICNATRDGIEKIRQWEKQLEIVLSAMDSRQRMMGEGQFRRARKALMDLAIAIMLDEKESRGREKNGEEKRGKGEEGRLGIKGSMTVVGNDGL